MQHYTKDYYSHEEERSRLAARVIVPLVLELVRPNSVIDVGCGTGEWLSVFGENGVEDVWGVDGAYVPRDLLKIPQDRFIPADLEHPLNVNRKFDLVVSLEVAEHLSNRSAEIFVDSLTGLGPLILFSAAIPHQGGVNHINEQWQEYWAKLFDNRGYTVIDPLRRKVWNNEDVPEYYAQNILMFVAREQLGNYPLLSTEYKLREPSMLSVVHPKTYLQKEEQAEEQAKLHNALEREASRILKRILPDNGYRLMRATYRLIRAALRRVHVRTS
jgi:SAM-dependent methyltransferase